MKSQLLATGLATMIATTSLALAAPSNVTPAGAAWLRHAVSDSNGEVQSCRMAEQKATAANIKSFCSRMISDHVKMASQGTQLARQLGIRVTQAAPEDTVKDQHELAALSGTAFDRKFMELQVQDHQKDVATTRDAIDGMNNPKLKSFAQQGLAQLQTHLMLAKSTAASMPPSTHR